MKIKVRNSILHLPLLTILLAGACLALFLYAPFSDIAVYDRSLVFSGDVWRVLSGHLVHFSRDHLLYNFVFLLIAGYLLEKENAYTFMLLTFTSGLAIGLYLPGFAPDYAQYGGMSGILSAYLVYFCAQKIYSARWHAWPWIALLLLFLAKIIIELMQGVPIFVIDGDFRVATSVHIIGGLIGLLFFVVIERRKYPKDILLPV